MAATKWTPQVIAAEVARKKAVGEDRNFGKPVSAAPKLQVKTPAPAAAPFNKDAYTAGQTARYNGAVNSGDTGLVSRLQADSKRVGYTLPQLNVKTGGGAGGAGVGGAGGAGSGTNSTGGGNFQYGGNIVSFTPPAGGNPNTNDIQKQIADLGDQWWKAPAGDRAAIHEKSMALGTAAGGTFDSKTGKWTFPTPQAAPETAPEGDYTGADVQAEIDAQIRGLMSEIDTLKSGAMFGVNQNNAFLDEQIGKLRTGKNQNDLQIQETENRFGGVYSGGMRLGQAANLTSTNEAIGGISRDVAARNQNLIDQLGTQTSTIAANIADIQAKTPQLIRDRILDYQTKTAPLTGMFNGKPTMDAKDQDFKQGVTMSQLTGFLPNGQATTDEQQRQLTNLWKVAAETGVIPNTLADLYGIKRGTKTQAAYEFAKQISLSQFNADTSRQSSDNAAGNAAFDNLIAVWKATKVAPDGLQAWGIQPGTPYAEDGGSGGSSDAPSALDSNIRTYFDGMVQRDEYTGEIKNIAAIEKSILSAQISDYDKYQLYQRYEIPWNGPAPIPNL